MTKLMRIRTLTALAAVFLAAAPAAAPAAAQQTQEFHSTAGFTVELPAHWELMPCEAMIEAMASAAGYDLEAVFKVGNAPWLAPPMFGIAWVELPEKMTVKEFGEEFTVPDAQEYLQAELFGTLAGDVPAAASASRWDPDSRSAWLRVSFKSDGTSPAFAASAFTLAPSGYAIIIFAYYGAPHTDPERAQAELEAVVRSLRPD